MGWISDALHIVADAQTKAAKAFAAARKQHRGSGLQGNIRSNRSDVEAERAKQAEKQREKDPIATRLRGARNRLNGTVLQLEELREQQKHLGLLDRVNGVAAGLKDEIQANEMLYDEYKRNVAALEKAQAEGNVEAAKKVRADTSGYFAKSAEGRRQFDRAAKSMDRAASIAKATRNTAVITGAIIATGGAAGIGVGAGVGVASTIAGSVGLGGSSIATGVVAAGIGTAVGTGIGLASNVAGAEASDAVGYQTREEAYAQAWAQTRQDLKSSACASVSCVVAGPLAGRAGSAVASRLGSLGVKTLEGAVAGGVQVGGMTALEKSVDRCGAEFEFMRGPRGLSKQEFMRERRLDLAGMASDTAWAAVVGGLTGGLGGRTSFLSSQSGSMAAKAGYHALGAGGSFGIGVGTAYLRNGGQVTSDDIINESVNAAIGFGTGYAHEYIGRQGAGKPAAETNYSGVRKITEGTRSRLRQGWDEICSALTLNFPAGSLRLQPAYAGVGDFGSLGPRSRASYSRRYSNEAEATCLMAKDRSGRGNADGKRGVQEGRCQGAALSRAGQSPTTILAENAVPRDLKRFLDAEQRRATLSDPKAADLDRSIAQMFDAIQNATDASDLKVWLNKSRTSNGRGWHPHPVSVKGHHGKFFSVCPLGHSAQAARIYLRYGQDPVSGKEVVLEVIFDREHRLS